VIWLGVTSWAFFENIAADPQPIAVCREGDKTNSLFACVPLSVEAQFDAASRRFQIISNQGYMAQALSEQLRRERPKEYADLEAKGRSEHRASRRSRG
jgi:hypothetical protein